MHPPTIYLSSLLSSEKSELSTSTFHPSQHHWNLGIWRKIICLTTTKSWFWCPQIWGLGSSTKHRHEQEKILGKNICDMRCFEVDMWMKKNSKNHRFYIWVTSFHFSKIHLVGWTFEKAYVKFWFLFTLANERKRSVACYVKRLSQKCTYKYTVYSNNTRPRSRKIIPYMRRNTKTNWSIKEFVFCKVIIVCVICRSQSG